jgi:rhamnogalacturonyl hydrolase YesR
LLSLDDVRQSLDQVCSWVEDHEYRGYEPFDGLSSWARPLTFRNLMAERILQQLIRQSPINLRPLMGISQKDSTKGRGYMAWGYLILYRALQTPDLLQRATSCLEWLDMHKVARFKDHSWSNHFDFSSRGGSYTKDDPIIVWTALIGHAYLEAFECTGNEWFLDIAKSVARWIIKLPREMTNSGLCISYVADCQSSIHNSNMLGASLLARTARHTGDSVYLEVARQAMQYSCSRQLPDGGWWYAEAPMYHWIDNFHTGYNLESLHVYMEATGDTSYRKNFDDGLRFYKAHFFEPSGRPKYYHSKTYPVDIQCIAQSIDTLALVSDYDPPSLDLACHIAEWAIRNMQDHKGYFYYRQYPLIKAKTPMLHWGQGTMYKGLARLFSRLYAAEIRNQLHPDAAAECVPGMQA